MTSAGPLDWSDGRETPSMPPEHRRVIIGLVCIIIAGSVALGVMAGEWLAAVGRWLMGGG